MLNVYLGYDPREDIAYKVAEHSLKRRASEEVKVTALEARHLSEMGLLWRTVVYQKGQMWDVISEAPQSTEFAISRFLTPIIQEKGWALFADCDVVFLDDVKALFDLADPKYALMCVKHNYQPKTDAKMDSQIQTLYSRKNWSSVMLFNCDHPSNAALTTEMVNSLPGRDLHRFCWLKDEEIGELPKEWNCLVGEQGYDIDTAKIAHFTLGGPWLGGTNGEHEDSVWLEEHKAYLESHPPAVVSKSFDPI